MYIFSNATLHSLYIDSQTESFISRNLWKFQDTSHSNETTINSGIQPFRISGYNFDQDKNIMNKLVFENLLQIYMVRSIKDELFGSFKS